MKINTLLLFILLFNVSSFTQRRLRFTIIDEVSISANQTYRPENSNNGFGFIKFGSKKVILSFILV